MKYFICLLTSHLVLSVPVIGQVPNKISYQGLLTGSERTPFANGSYDLKFDIFELPMGGTQRYIVYTHSTAGGSPPMAFQFVTFKP